MRSTSLTREIDEGIVQVVCFSTIRSLFISNTKHRYSLTTRREENARTFAMHQRDGTTV